MGEKSQNQETRCLYTGPGYANNQLTMNLSAMHSPSKLQVVESAYTHWALTVYQAWFYFTYIATYLSQQSYEDTSVTPLFRWKTEAWRG